MSNSKTLTNHFQKGFIFENICENKINIHELKVFKFPNLIAIYNNMCTLYMNKNGIPVHATEQSKYFTLGYLE